MAKTILVVEDDLDTCNLIDDILQLSGCFVTKAKNLSEVKAILQTGYRPELVVADLQIPGCAYDGETIDLIKSMCRPNDVEILLISATTGVQSLANMYNVNYLEKPFDLDDFINYITPAV